MKNIQGCFIPEGLDIDPVKLKLEATVEISDLCLVSINDNKPFMVNHFLFVDLVEVHLHEKGK